LGIIYFTYFTPTSTYNISNEEEGKERRSTSVRTRKMGRSGKGGATNFKVGGVVNALEGAGGGNTVKALKFEKGGGA